MRRYCIPIFVCVLALTFLLGMTASAAPKWASILFAGRQGGSATDWSVPGTTNYNSMARVQVGVIQGVPWTGATVTFPEPFEATPWCMVVNDRETPVRWTATATTLTVTTYTDGPVRWIAVGP